MGRGVKTRTFSELAASFAPTACCEESELCWDEGAACKTDPARRASLTAEYVRLGKSPERTASNPTGGGRKVWFPPGKSDWWRLEDLQAEMEACEGLPGGFYTLSYADAQQREIKTAAPVNLEYDASLDGSETEQGPAPRQTHMDRALDVNLKRAELDNKSKSYELRSLRRMGKILHETNLQNLALVQAQTELLKAMADSLLQQTGTLGAQAEAVRLGVVRQASALLTQQPQKSVVEHLVGISTELRQWAPIVRQIAGSGPELGPAKGQETKAKEAHEVAVKQTEEPKPEEAVSAHDSPEQPPPTERHTETPSGL